MFDHWSTHQLVEFLAAVSHRQEAASAASAAVELAAEALEAEVGAVVLDEQVIACIGFGSAPVPRNLARAARVGQAQLRLPGVGDCNVASAPFEVADGHLVVARVHDEWSAEERSLLSGMARVLGLTLRTLRTLDVERTLRAEQQRQAEERLKLLASLRERQRLLETLLEIQRSIAHRAPLQAILDSVTSGASRLLHGHRVSLVLADPADAARPILASTSGDGSGAEASEFNAEIHLAALAAMNGIARETGATDHAAVTTELASPVHINGEFAGGLVASAAAGFASSECETLRVFAEHASLALTDARTLEAMHQAFHDSLTGLPNRALFLDRLHHALALAQRRGTRLAVLFIDLDGFKLVNDSLGHAAGDELLNAVAIRLRESLRETDTVARFGGDEFAVLLEDAESIEHAKEVANRIISQLRQPFCILTKDVFIGASIGIAVAGTAERRDPDELLRHADLAMYSAKKDGRGRCRLFEPGMHRAVLERLELDAQLQQAVAAEQLRLQYQPVVRLDTGEPVGIEALVRWFHPDRGMVSPATFIPLAEENGAIIEIGRWVLREACRQAAQWRQLQPELSVSVNLSGRQVADDGLIADVMTALTESGLPADALTLEITESVLMRDHCVAGSRLQQLRALGVRLAIDDFGTGYSSLSYLRQFPFDILKIDKSFVANVCVNGQDSALARSIVDLGKTLSLMTVAEGIETLEQLEHLRSVHCQLGQGYYFARPLPAEDVASYLRRFQHDGATLARA